MTEEPYLDPKRYVTWRALGTIIVVLWALQFGLECLVSQQQTNLESKFEEMEAMFEAAAWPVQADEQKSDEEAERANEPQSGKEAE